DPRQEGKNLLAARTAHGRRGRRRLPGAATRGHLPLPPRGDLRVGGVVRHRLAGDELVAVAQDRQPVPGRVVLRQVGGGGRELLLLTEAVGEAEQGQLVRRQDRSSFRDGWS